MNFKLFLVDWPLDAVSCYVEVERCSHARSTTKPEFSTGALLQVQDWISKTLASAPKLPEPVTCSEKFLIKVILPILSAIGKPG